LIRNVGVSIEGFVLLVVHGGASTLQRLPGCQNVHYQLHYKENDVFK